MIKKPKLEIYRFGWFGLARPEGWDMKYTFQETVVG
jgi:hypothetical protein